MSSTPMPGQATSVLDLGSENLALKAGLEALIMTLNPAQKQEFLQNLRGRSVRGNPAYMKVIVDLESITAR
ncbi:MULTISPECIES: hypothetical protein [Stenotrophomonas]|uniref:hypothetical protein n=1 Tax=Stenotrophomonas TaxID=40323 RepID=UPI000871D9A4|nr:MULTISPECIES: hypothetical protein [Stenotrophomonas]OEZ02302.1 hypothetical protein BIY45_01875 [Stenotrophomonas sp. BIIR7]